MEMQDISQIDIILRAKANPFQIVYTRIKISINSKTILMRHKEEDIYSVNKTLFYVDNILN